jgi:hypothetical protein
MELTYTAEKVARHIAAAYDSVALITELKAKESLTEEETAIMSRNVQHIHVMLEEAWFAEGLTPEQKTELEAI